MKAVYRHLLEPLHFPVDGYLFIVRTETSIDGGKTFYYGGKSRYFLTAEEAAEYKAEQERQDAEENP